MKIIEPSVELWKQDDAIAHVARCARICYRKETGNDERLCNNLIKSKHWSTFRHRTVYAIIPMSDVAHMWSNVMGKYLESPYIDWVSYGNFTYVVTNGNFLLDIERRNPLLYKWLTEYEVDAKVFEEEAKIPSIKELIRYTFKVTTQISTSRELNRVSPNTISEQSTRYVYEDGSICRPHKLIGYNIFKDIYDKYIIYKDNQEIKDNVLDYIQGCDEQFRRYKRLVNNGWDKQDARGVLPLDTATICAYTYSASEWRHIIDLRYYGITGKPHPNAEIIAGMIRKELIKLGYDFR